MSISSQLDSFQLAVLEAFFRREQRFFLSGGAALAGFHLGHRATKDLDLFTTEDALASGISNLRAVAEELDADIEALQTTPDFHRLLLRRQDASVVVDLIRERVPQIYPDKLQVGLIQVDPAEEILLNKLGAVLSRSEVRDLVDLHALEASGLSIEAALPQAQQKDGGLTPGQLAWVLSQVHLTDEDPTGQVSCSELEDWIRGLEDRLNRLAFPG